LIPSERRFVDAVKARNCEIKTVAYALGVTSQRVQELLKDVSRALKFEKNRRARDRKRMSPENRPIEDLLLDRVFTGALKGSKWKIKTIGSLMKRSEAEVLLIRWIGEKGLQQIKDRLWAMGELTLRDSGTRSSIPASSPDQDTIEALSRLPHPEAKSAAMLVQEVRQLLKSKATPFLAMLKNGAPEYLGDREAKQKWFSLRAVQQLALFKSMIKQMELIYLPGQASFELAHITQLCIMQSAWTLEMYIKKSHLAGKLVPMYARLARLRDEISRQVHLPHIREILSSHPASPAQPLEQAA
jgi:hypothetical protein